jgi:hypothetical protein
MKRKINNNDLLPWFTMDHDQLPDAYKKSCQKFFDELQATSNKRQASSLTAPAMQDIIGPKQKGIK